MKPAQLSFYDTLTSSVYLAQGWLNGKINKIGKKNAVELPLFKNFFLILINELLIY
jgi:hypothetical protein